MLADINRLLTTYRPSLGAMDLDECLQAFAEALDNFEDSPC